METDNINQTDNTVNNNDEQSPFTEEFDKNLVVNKEQPDKPKKGISDEELIEILSLTDDERKKEGFKRLIKGDPDEFERPTEELLKKRFKDYIQLTEIAGREADMPHSNRVPANKVKDSGYTLEILDDPSTTDDGKHSSVFVHKNEKDEIELIEVVCSCGKKTFISLQTPDAEKEGEYPDVGLHEFNYEELKEKENK
jgi:hypothetical protein